MIWTPKKQIVWPNRQRGFFMLPGGMGASKPGDDVDVMALLSSILHYWDMDEADDTSTFTTRVDRRAVGEAWDLTEYAANKSFSEEGLRGGSSVAATTAVNEPAALRHLNRTAAITGSQNTTIAGWVYPKIAPGGPRTIFRESAFGTNTNQMTHWIGYDNAGVAGAPYNLFGITTGATSGDYSKSVDTEEFAINTWQFVQMKVNRSAGVVSIRINDGAWSNSEPTTLPAAYVAAGDVQFGSTMTSASAGLDVMTGRFQYWGYYGRLLTDAELNYLFNGGAGKEYNEILADALSDMPVDPYIDDVAIYLKFDGEDGSTDFIDITGRVWTRSGTPVIDTDQSVRGGASGLFNGTTDYITTADDPDLDIGDQDFFLECRVRFNGTVPTTSSTMIGKWNETGNQRSWYVRKTGSESEHRLVFGFSTLGTDTNTRSAPWNPAPDTWYSIGVGRHGEDLLFFIDGELVHTDLAASAFFNSTAPVTVGAINTNSTPTSLLPGWVDEERLTVGVCRYTSSYNPETEQLLPIFVAVVNDPFDGVNSAPLQSHLTAEGYEWRPSEELFYPGTPVNVEWQIQDNKLVPQDFPVNIGDVFNFIDVDVDAQQYEILLTFSIDTVPGSNLQIGIVSNLQELETPSVYGFIQHYIYAPLGEGSTTVDVSSTQDVQEESGVDPGDTSKYREGAYGGSTAAFPRLETGEHVMKVAIDRTGASMVAKISLDGVEVDTRTFNSASYDYYGTEPFPSQVGKVGFNIYHPGDADNVKVLNFEVKVSSGETLAPSGFPVIEETSKGGSSTNTTTHPITMPAGVTTGDLLVVLFGQDDDGLIPATVNIGSSGAGWARLYEANQGSDHTRFSCFYKIATGSDTLTITTGFSDTSDWIVYRISGASSALTASTTTNTTNDPPSLTAGMGSAKYLCLVHALISDGHSISAAASGFDGIINGATAGLSQIRAASFSRKFKASSEDPGTYTTTPSATARALLATIAVPPTLVAANFPVVEEITTTAFNTSVKQHLVVMPATVNNGDLLLCHVSNDGLSLVASPDGWNVITSASVSTARGSYFYRIADGTEGGTTVDFATPALGEEAAAIVHRIRQGTYLGIPEGTYATGATSLTVDPPAFTPSWGDLDMLVIGAFSGQNVTTISSWPYPNGQTTVQSSGSTNVNCDAHSCYSYASVSPVDPPTFYKVGNGNPTVNMTIAVRGPLGSYDPPVADPHFADVTALLHFDGSDGSTTFTDNSVIAATFTTGGNAQIDTADSKFGGASGLFDGTGDYLSASYVKANYDWWVEDTTIEMRVKASSWASWAYNLGAGDHPVAVGNGAHNTTINYWSFGPITDGRVRFYYYNGVAQFGAVSTSTLSTGAWHHIAMVASAAGIRIFLDGVLDTTVAIAGLPQSSADTPLTIGQINSQALTGWIDELRITKGVARYTATFTPPIAAFPNS